MKTTLLIISLTLLTSLGKIYAQNVNIPDVNFKTYLLGNSNINTNLDSEIQVSEAEAFSGVISCNGLNISDLTGIEAFTSLFSLECSSNQLTTLNVSTIPTLYNLDISSNSITSLNVSSNFELRYLTCNNNLITNINVSAIYTLQSLYCNNNQLMSLDVSGNYNLVSLECRYNQLTSLNVKNNNNMNMYLFAENNPNLICIKVDDASYCTNFWTNIDPTASFSEDCTSTANVKNNTNNTINFYPNPNSGNFNINSNAPITSIEILDFNGKVIDFTSFQNEIQLTNKVDGFYFLKTTFENGSYSLQKFIVE